MRKNGFTLVELMVIIVIIGVLAAVAMPKFAEAINKARVTERMNESGVNTEAIPYEEFSERFKYYRSTYELYNENDWMIVADSMTAYFSGNVKQAAPEKKEEKKADTTVISTELAQSVDLENPAEIYSEVSSGVYLFLTQDVGKLAKAIQHYQGLNSDLRIRNVETISDGVLITFEY